MAFAVTVFTWHVTARIAGVRGTRALVVVPADRGRSESVRAIPSPNKPTGAEADGATTVVPMLRQAGGRVRGVFGVAGAAELALRGSPENMSEGRPLDVFETENIRVTAGSEVARYVARARRLIAANGECGAVTVKNREPVGGVPG